MYFFKLQTFFFLENLQPGKIIIAYINYNFNYLSAKNVYLLSKTEVLLNVPEFDNFLPIPEAFLWSSSTKKLLLKWLLTTLAKNFIIDI